MKDGNSMIEHLNAFNTVVSQLSSVDIKISDEDKCISFVLFSTKFVGQSGYFNR